MTDEPGWVTVRGNGARNTLAPRFSFSLSGGRRASRSAAAPLLASAGLLVVAALLATAALLGTGCNGRSSNGGESVTPAPTDMGQPTRNPARQFPFHPCP